MQVSIWVHHLAAGNDLCVVPLQLPVNAGTHRRAAAALPLGGKLSPVRTLVTDEGKEQYVFA